MYKEALPEVFFTTLTATPEVVREYVEKLLRADRKDVPQGSSFAVTVDNWNGTWNLWLSEASYNYLNEEDS